MRLSPGCNCCPTGPACSICPTVFDGCTSPATIAGATVTVKSGATVIGTGSTGSSGPGKCCVTVPASGTYTVTVAKSGYSTYSGSVTATCPGETDFNVFLDPAPNLSVTIVVGGCGGQATGAVVVLTRVADGSTQTCSTSLGGIHGTSVQCVFTVPTTGDYTFTVTYNGGARLAIFSGSLTVTGCAAITRNVVLDPKPGFMCDAILGVGCVEPWANPLHATDSVFGAITLTGSDPRSGSWTGTSAPVASCAAGVPPGTTMTAQFEFDGGGNPSPPGGGNVQITVTDSTGTNYPITQTMDTYSPCPPGFSASGHYTFGGCALSGTWTMTE